MLILSSFELAHPTITLAQSPPAPNPGGVRTQKSPKALLRPEPCPLLSETLRVCRAWPKGKRAKLRKSEGSGGFRGLSVYETFRQQYQNGGI